MFVQPILAAAIVGTLVLAIGVRPWRRSRGVRGASFGAALAVAAAYVAAYASVHGGLPGWPPVEVGHWLLLFVALSPLLALAPEGGHAVDALRWGLRTAGIALFLWMGLEPLRVHAWGAGEGSLWLGGLGVGWLLLFASHGALARRRSGVEPALIAALACGGTAAVVGQSTGGTALLAAGMGAVCGAWIAISVWRREARLAPGAFEVLSVALPGLLVIGHLFAAAPASSCLLVALAPQATWILPRRAGAGPFVVRALVALAVCALGAWLALPEPSPYGGS